MSRTPFLITVDTEGDNLWARPREITTRNAEYLPRFQALCERFGFRPVYLTNYEMVKSRAFCEFAEDVLARDAGEVGMHMHAWNSPPLEALTPDDLAHHPYLTEFPKAVMRRKIATLTDLLEERFACKMVSHRAGRWGFDGRYATILIEHGYRVDCSVTPGVDWSSRSGDPLSGGGPDYSRFSRRPYFLDPADIAEPASSGLLEVPVTIRPGTLYTHARWPYSVPLVRRVVHRVSPGLPWLCPIQPSLRTSLERHLKVMVEVARAARRDGGEPHLEFMVHSSELMPGGSPEFRTAADIELLYEHLEVLFDELSAWCSGTTLAEFRAQYDDRGQVRRALAEPTRAPDSDTLGAADSCVPRSV